MKNIILIIGTFLLLSCSNSNKKLVEIKTVKYILQSEISFKTKTPIHYNAGGFAKNINSGEWISFINDEKNFVIEYPADYPKENPIFMSDMSIEKEATNCSPTTLGASETNELEIADAKTLWGKTDIWKLSKQEGYIPPYDTSVVACAPSAPNIYAFCSEKDGKTVVICISQQKDNPTLAKQIFDSFKWTK